MGHFHRRRKDRREGIVFGLSREVPGANQKLLAFQTCVWPQAGGFWRIGLSPRPPRLERVPFEDEWAVRGLGMERFSDLVLRNFG
jgi:hypothetical protein